MQQLLTQYRRDLHQIPETDFDLPETCVYVRKVLEQYSCEIFTPCSSTICAFFDAGKTTTAAFRADMDALPIQEKRCPSYASRHPGKMHACGHDGHMAMVLALADVVNRNLERLKQNALLVFQPAEETTGGAKLVCQSGVFTQFHCPICLWCGRTLEEEAGSQRSLSAEIRKAGQRDGPERHQRPLRAARKPASLFRRDVSGGPERAEQLIRGH